MHQCLACATWHPAPLEHLQELRTPTDGTSKLKSFNTVCALAFGGAAVLMGTVMSVGYLTFGASSQVGFLLYTGTSTLGYAHCNLQP